MKFYESRFQRLTFDTLSQMTVAKFNGLPDSLDQISDADPLELHSSIEETRQSARQEHSVQLDFMRSNAERKQSKVYIFHFVHFFLILM